MPIAKQANIPEVLLRLGCSLVAWMVLYTHCIWLATSRVVGCGPDGDELWRLLLGFAPIALGFSFLISAIQQLPEVAQIMRWLAAPFVLLIPLAIWPVITTFTASTLGSESICNTHAWWHAWWAPVQLLTLGVITYSLYRNCKATSPVASQ
ncbi:MAG: hypothetical protein GXP16_04020 [Gammaproteobacteria bacterium]|nr:hypothetical protein [Gammaproteobacteria bacterium]